MKNRNQGTWIVGSLVITAITAVGLLFVRKHVTSNELRVIDDSGSTLMRVSGLRNVHLYDPSTDKEVILPGDESPRSRLFVILSAADCTACLGQLPEWNTLAASLPAARFEGTLIFVNSSAAEIKEFKNNYRPLFRVLYDKRDEVSRLVGLPPKTPVSILTDGRMRVLVAQGATTDYNAQEGFVGKIQEQVLGVK